VQHVAAAAAEPALIAAAGRLPLFATGTVATAARFTKRLSRRTF